jgi:hypothetical protein
MDMRSNLIKIPLTVLIFQISFVFPIFNLAIDVPTVLTSISLLFAILIGFFIAAATSNYLNLQSAISKEDSTLITVYELVKIIQPSSAKRIARLIDNYMIAALDYDLLDYAANTSDVFRALTKAIDDICIADKTKHVLVQNLQDAKGELVAYRMESMLATQCIVTKKHWIILSALSLLMAVMLLSLRNGSFWTSFLIGMTIFAIYQTLSLLYEIDSNSFLADKIGYDSEPQSVFRAIGMPGYYPENALRLINKDRIGKKYRVGVYLDYPASFEKNIKLVDNTKNNIK